MQHPTYNIGEEITVHDDWKVKIESALGKSNNLHYTYLCQPLNKDSEKVVLKKYNYARHSANQLQEIAQASFAHFNRTRDQLLAAGFPNMRFYDNIHSITDYVPGHTLEGHTPSQAINDRVTYIRDLLLSLTEPMEGLRQAGLVHRDIKPSNIVVRPDVVPGMKGAATPIDLDSLTPILTTRPLVKPSAVYGSGRHIPAEVSSLGFHQFESDVYALGVTGIEMIERYLSMTILGRYTETCWNFWDFAEARQLNKWLLRDRWPQLVEDVSKSPYSLDPRSVRQVLGFIHECLHDEASDRPKNGEVMRQLLADTGNIKEL